jgi:hypothetical protein
LYQGYQRVRSTRPQAYGSGAATIRCSAGAAAMLARVTASRAHPAYQGAAEGAEAGQHREGEQRDRL